MRIGCILLAAGSGRRFGGDKLLCEIDGVSMAERACMLHAGIDYAARVLVARPGDSAVMDIAKRHGFSVVVNERAARGVGTSAAAGAAAMLALDAPVDGALFAVCDQPYLSRATVTALIRRFSDASDAIVAPSYGEKRGNPVIFPQTLLFDFTVLDGDVGGSAVIRAHSGRLVTVPVEDQTELMDMDYRTDEMRNRNAYDPEG